MTGYTEPDHEGTELARVLAAMAGPPAPLILPPDESAPTWTPEQIAEFKVRLEVAMAKYAPLRVLPSEHWKDRAEAAEANLAAIRELCEEAGTRTGGRILAIIGSDEEPRDG